MNRHESDTDILACNQSHTIPYAHGYKQHAYISGHFGLRKSAKYFTNNQQNGLLQVKPQRRLIYKNILFVFGLEMSSMHEGKMFSISSSQHIFTSTSRLTEGEVRI